MSNLAHDLRLAIRTLLKRPGFAVVTVLTLALGIGANSAIFSVVNAVLLEPLPYEEPEGLVNVWTQLPEAGRKPLSVVRSGVSRLSRRDGPYSRSWEPSPADQPY